MVVRRKSVCVYVKKTDTYVKDTTRIPLLSMFYVLPCMCENERERDGWYGVTAVGECESAHLTTTTTLNINMYITAPLTCANTT